MDDDDVRHAWTDYTYPDAQGYSTPYIGHGQGDGAGGEDLVLTVYLFGADGEPLVYKSQRKIGYV